MCLVTDHHLPGEELPGAEVIVNPNQHGCAFASKSLAGVGVIFYVLSALRAELRQRGWFSAEGITEPNLGDALDLVALGTVADVVPLDRNNRILVAAGLARIRSGRARPGIEALFEVAGRDYRQANASDLGFIVGPRLNAAGRLDDMSIGIECLLAESSMEARERAETLHRLNRERRDIEQSMEQDALKQLASLSFDSTELPFAMTLYDPDWHQGVIEYWLPGFASVSIDPPWFSPKPETRCSRVRGGLFRACTCAMRWIRWPRDIQVCSISLGVMRWRRV